MCSVNVQIYARNCVKIVSDFFRPKRAIIGPLRPKEMKDAKGKKWSWPLFEWVVVRFMAKMEGMLMLIEGGRARTIGGEGKGYWILEDSGLQVEDSES